MNTDKIEMARKAYKKAVALAQKTHDEAIAPVWEAYLKATVPTRKACDEAIAQAEKVYREVCREESEYLKRQ